MASERCCSRTSLLHWILVNDIERYGHISGGKLIWEKYFIHTTSINKGKLILNFYSFIHADKFFQSIITFQLHPAQQGNDCSTKKL